MSVPRRVDLIGVPMDLGADRRGVDMGPSAVRYAQLAESLTKLGVGEVVDHGNLVVSDRSTAAESVENAKYLPIIRTVCAELAELVERIARDGSFPLVLGGDHSIAMGTLDGLYRARGRQAGLIWVDAHADINSPQTSPSGNVHGMPLSFAFERYHVSPARTVFIGLRDVDAGERETIARMRVRSYTMSDVDRLGIHRVMEEAIAHVGGSGRPIHCSFDMDGIDPSFAPGVGTPVRGGLTYREAHTIMEMLARSGQLQSLEITEINPILDRENQTAILAVELILSALGKTIL